MASSLYKDFKTTRDLTYHYYLSAPTSTEIWLLFLHGFPSTSRDWRHQIDFFKKHGYGLIVPDLLGYGGTSKPTEVEAYKKSLISKDLVELLDHEKADRVVVIGHDWGSALTGRLANFYPERFVGFGFLSVGYTPPTFGPRPNFQAVLALTKQLAGYELFGYWQWFGGDDGSAAKVVEEHIDSFLSLIYAADPKIWSMHFTPTGVLRPWLEADSKVPCGTYVSEEDIAEQKATLLKGGLTGPLSWYRVNITDVEHNDNQTISKENVLITKPVFFGAALNDPVAFPVLMKQGISKATTNHTIKDYNSAHWVQIEAKDEVNRDLLAWVQDLEKK